MVHKKNTKSSQQKNKFTAKLSFYLSLGFVIPLFNIGLALISIIYGVKALRLIANDPKKYGGLGFALAGLVIGIATFLTSLLFMGIFLYGQILASSAC
jgi:hypothetical protein